MDKKPLDHPDYKVPGTNIVSFSKWSRENEPKPPHTIPLGTIIEWEGEHIDSVENRCGDEICLGFIGKITAYVVDHHFDCDGSALYHIAMKPVKPPKEYGERLFKWLPLCGPEFYGISERSLKVVREKPAEMEEWAAFIKRKMLRF